MRRALEGRVGIDYCDPEITDICGTPFFAVCGHLRQVNDYGGNVDVETGWAWRGRTGSVFRLGMQYFNGMSEQGQFYNKYEEGDRRGRLVRLLVPRPCSVDTLGATAGLSSSAGNTVGQANRGTRHFRSVGALAAHSIDGLLGDDQVHADIVR